MKNKNELLLDQYLVDNLNNLYCIAFSYCKNEEDAKDILSNATVKAYISINKLRDISFLKTWFYRILINECHRNYAKRKKIYFIFDEEDIPEPKTENITNYSDLYQAIDHLSIKYKTIIILKYFEELTIKEISAILKINENTIKTRLYHALKILKIEMEELNEL